MQIERIGAPQYTGNGSDIDISLLNITIRLEDEDVRMELRSAVSDLQELKGRLENSGPSDELKNLKISDINNSIFNKTVYIIDHRAFEKPLHYISGDRHYYLYKNIVYRADGAYSPLHVEYQIRINERRLPHSIEQAVLCLMEELSFETKIALMSCARQDAVFLNFSLVAKIKNKFGLNGSNKKLFASCISKTTDEASCRIIESLWDRLQETMI